jgi:hypothetical protein
MAKRPSKNAKENNRDTGINDPDGRKQTRQIAKGISALKDTIAEDGYANREQDERQERGKKWREISTLIFIILTTGGVFIQAYVLHTTDEAMQAAARAAKDSAVAAKAAVELSDRTAERQLRAYVGITLPEDGPATSSFVPPAIPTIRLGIRNSGQTPAYDVEYSAIVDIRAYPLNDFSGPPATNPSNPITLFPGTFALSWGMTIRPKRALTDEEVVSIQDGKSKRLYFWGTIKYRDAFNKPRWTTFCLGFYAVSSKSHQYEPCNRHNEADNE